MLWLKTVRGNDLPALYLDRGHRLTLLVSHANAEDMGQSARMWSVLGQHLKANVFCYEWSGYGHATGTPSEANLHADATAALVHLMEVHELRPASEIVLVGKSLGTCACCHLASKETFRGLLLISGIASGMRVRRPEFKPELAPAGNRRRRVRQLASRS